MNYLYIKSIMESTTSRALHAAVILSKKVELRLGELTIIQGLDDDNEEVQFLQELEKLADSILSNLRPVSKQKTESMNKTPEFLLIPNSSKADNLYALYMYHAELLKADESDGGVRVEQLEDAVEKCGLTFEEYQEYADKVNDGTIQLV